MPRRLPLLLSLLAAFALCLIAGGIVYNIPAVNDRLYPRIDKFVSDVRELVAPAPETVPTAAAVANLPTFAPDTPTPVLPTVTQTQPPNDPATQQPNNLTTEPPTSTPIPIVYDLPASFSLDGARYEPQLYNNCGPATLTAALVYWGWRGSEPDGLTWYGNGVDVRWQKDIAKVIKPNKSDKNVMPYELGNFATDNAGLDYVIRYGGDIDVIRRFVANGFPVIIERGFREEEHGQVGQGWEGHYGLITGYDDDNRRFLTQDSFKGPNYFRDYDSVVRDWHDFNYLYLILYPPDRAAQVISLLGPEGDAAANYNRALVKAQAEAAQHADPADLAFDWFNVGTSLQLLGRNQDAALAFDQARSYNTLPYRMLWYQTFMYKAYFYSERYQDVITLADATLQTPGLEESYYWRGWAYYQLGDLDRAATDMRAALDAHPNWDQALSVLAQWGVNP
ncbi:MAG TPA: C39 family peptidase [Anaerolineales bacterium]|nr:C39 family peptidase [Anaerolineales bacterium]HLB47070.1 C39 family peptidase [Anaerolineales bacterium]